MSETNNYNFYNCGGHGYTISVLRLLKEPAATVEELWLRYPKGGEYGWYVFVNSKKMFYYWDIDSKAWESMQSENLEDIITHGALRVGDIPFWDGDKFVVANLNIYGTEDY